MNSSKINLPSNNAVSLLSVKLKIIFVQVFEWGCLLIANTFFYLGQDDHIWSCSIDQVEKLTKLVFEDKSILKEHVVN